MTLFPAVHPLWLASRSPRRRSLLDEAGVSLRVQPPSIDDGRLVPGPVSSRAWVMSLAYLKARCVREMLADAGGHAVGTVLAADTVCAHRGRILGQPRDADDARRMLRSLRADAHETVTGVCLIGLADAARWLLVDAARVQVGAIPDEEIDRYVDSGAWQGKAGGYNLDERIAAGWPIECDGDPATVMGLPMRRLEAWLAAIREAPS